MSDMPDEAHLEEALLAAWRDAHRTTGGPMPTTDFDQVAAAIEELDAAYARREHGGVAQGHAIDTIRAVVRTAAARAATTDYPPPVVDHVNQQVTFAVTFDWDRDGLHMDHCEVGVLAGDLQRLLVKWYREWPQIKAVHPVRTYEPLEERHIGSVQRTVPLR